MRRKKGEESRWIGARRGSKWGSDMVWYGMVWSGGRGDQVEKGSKNEGLGKGQKVSE